MDRFSISIQVVALREETFFGNIVVEANGQILNIDSRPSDAINLAARANVPILVSSEVMDAAGIIPDEDEVSEEAEYSDEAPTPGEGEGEERLSVFEDFLEQLNLDDEEENNN